ncbi:MAG: glycoside hydrolase family 15 protein [Flavobacteriaceae bacterium]
MSDLNYGIIGNCKSAALIHQDSSLEWLCLPIFDSPSVFAKLLDEKKGGSFKFNVSDQYRIYQKYLPETCILSTEFVSEEGSFEVLDFMPRYGLKEGGYYAPSQVVRYVKLKRGLPKLSITYDPNLEYGAGLTRTYIKEDFIVSVVNQPKFDTLYCYTNMDKDLVLSGEEFTLGQDLFFNISYHEKVELPSLSQIKLEMERTHLYWRDWCDRTPSYGEYNETVLRSAMTLKLLYFEKSGAVLAAATTSLPETIGEVRNWDYRFCWIRDASMVIKVISKLGHTGFVSRYIDFIIDLVPDKDEKLQIMYGINGEKELTEKSLEHLEGYEGSKPVRVGNAAYIQQQNDIYGILMDAMYFQLMNYGLDKDHKEKLWAIVKNIVWLVEQNWQDPDKGIWEFRAEDRHFTFSKLLCWVAIDRAIKFSEELFGSPKEMEWIELRDQIRKDIETHAWNEEKQAYTQSYGSSDLDASVLLMEPYGFIKGKDSRYISTVEGIERELVHNGLLFRYKNEDDFGLPSSSFTVCTFWFIDALYKTGQHEKSKEWFDRLLSYGNHLGLFSEDLDFESRRLLGNFPQAYSHLAIIDVAENFKN